MVILDLANNKIQRSTEYKVGRSIFQKAKSHINPILQPQVTGKVARSPYRDAQLTEKR